MNQKTYSILFCALLASTFVHEIRAKAAASPSFAAHVLERAADPQICQIVCGGTGSTGGNTTVNITAGLSILANVDANLFAVVNLTAKAGIIIDINSNIVAILNGTTGASVVINVETNAGVYISSGVWVSSNISFQAYLASLTGGLSFLLKISGAVSFKVASASADILTVINGVVRFLVLNISGQLQVNAKVGIQLIVAISSTIVGLLKGSLKGLLGIIGTIAIAIRIDLAGVLNLLQALGVIISKVSGGLTALLAAGVTLNLSVIGNAGSGLEILVNIILALGAKIDIGTVLGGILNDVESLFKFIAQLGGNGNLGLTGLFKVLSNLVAYLKGNSSLDVVINSIIQFLAYNSQSARQDLSLVLNGTLNVLLETIDRIGATKTLSGLVTTINALLQGTLEINGVSISAIITLLLNGISKSGTALLQVIVGVLLELRTFVSTGISLSTLLFVLILNVNTAIGIQLLIALGIAININIGSITGSIITSILKSVPNLLRLILGGDIYAVLSGLPVIGNIVVALNAAISAATNGSLSLKALLNASTFISGLIKGLFQVLVEIPLGVSSSIISQVQSALKACTSVNAYLGISLSFSIG